MSTARALKGASSTQSDEARNNTRDGENDNAAPAQALTDAVSTNRKLPITDVSRVPKVPAGYRPTDPQTRSPRGRLSESQLHLAMLAGRQILERRDHWRADLGDLAPDLSPLPAVLDDLEACDATVRALRALLAYHEERLDLARCDLNTLLRATHDEYAHRAPQMPQLDRHYSHLADLVGSIGENVVQGIRRARRTKKAPVTG